MDYSWILLMVVMFAMLYFFMIRPENKRKKEAENLRNSLAVGDEITTIADRVRIEVTKWAISTKNGQSTQATR